MVYNYINNNNRFPKKGIPSAIFVNSVPKTNGALCPVFGGGFGNHIFQLASTFGIAKSKNMTILVNEKNKC